MKNHEMSMSFVDQQWIERLAELQDRNSLTDVQAAMYLGIEESEFQSVKAGKKSLSLKSKKIFFSRMLNADPIPHFPRLCARFSELFRVVSWVLIGGARSPFNACPDGLPYLNEVVIVLRLHPNNGQTNILEHFVQEAIA